MSYTHPRTQSGERSDNIEIDGVLFEFVTQQREKLSAIYKSSDAYLRIGEREKIRRDLAFHKEMEGAGFPVARLLAEGELDGESYFIESSLGDEHFGKLFARDIEQSGRISSDTFEQFVAVAERFARAQATTRIEESYEDFAAGIWLPILCNEMPEYRDKLLSRFEEVRERAKVLPFVITHGDFNPNNLYPDGVIDLEDSFNGPFGYDIVGAVTHIDSFPDSHEYEYFAQYRFSSEQLQSYQERMDAVSADAGLLPISEYWSDFSFCRAVWLAADIPAVPRLQEFRFTQLVEQFLA